MKYEKSEQKVKLGKIFQKPPFIPPFLRAETGGDQRCAGLLRVRERIGLW
jgi:hypothetical protein